jgi:hypothetical protein
MITLKFLLPHSPLLLDSEERGLYFETRKAYKKVADDLLKEKVTAIVSIVSDDSVLTSPLLHIHNEFQADFSVFGDLVTKLTFSPWWNGFHTIRQNQTQPLLEPVETKKLPYQHALPLHLLTKSVPELKNIPVLAITLPANSEHGLNELSKNLATIFNQVPESIAIIGSGNLTKTKEKEAFKELSLINQDLRKQLLDQAEIKLNISKPEIFLSPTIAAPYYLLKDLDDKDTLQEYAYEKSDFTSFFVGSFN